MAESALDRMSELSVLCQDVTKSDVDRASYTSEFTQLQNFISDIGTKRFNGFNLFPDLALEATLEHDARAVPINAINLNAATPNGGLAEAYDPHATEINTEVRAAGAFTTITRALHNLADMQAKVSANIQRLNLSSGQLSILHENLSAASSRINNIDLARSFAEYARDTMLSRSGTAMVAQANTVPQATLKVLSQYP